MTEMTPLPSVPQPLPCLPDSVTSIKSRWTIFGIILHLVWQFLCCWATCHCCYWSKIKKLPNHLVTLLPENISLLYVTFYFTGKNPTELSPFGVCNRRAGLSALRCPQHLWQGQSVWQCRWERNKRIRKYILHSQGTQASTRFHFQVKPTSH